MEIKLRLADREAHGKVAEALRAHFRETHKQENFFFDGAKRELSSKRTVVRCRFYNIDKRALLTIKVSSSVLLVACLLAEAGLISAPLFRLDNKVISLKIE